MDHRRIAVAPGIDLDLLEAGAGTGRRRLLLVHGFTGAKEDFADHLDALAGVGDGWHVVAPDLRGHGGSAKPAGVDRYSFEALADDVLGLVDALGWDRFTLLGHSMGGMIAQVAALAAGGAARLDGLVLMDTSHGPIGGLDPDMIALGKAVVGEGGMAALVAAQRDTDGALDTPANQRVTAERPGYREFGEAKALACAADMWLGMIDEVVHAQADRLEALATGLAGVPTLVIVGDQDRPFLPHADRMAAAIPGADLVVVPDAGHSPQFENPNAWFAALSGFLGRVAATSGAAA